MTLPPQNLGAIELVPVGPSRPENPRVFDPAREAGRENQLRVQLPGDGGYTPHLRWLMA